MCVSYPVRALPKMRSVLLSALLMLCALMAGPTPATGVQQTLMAGQGNATGTGCGSSFWTLCSSITTVTSNGTNCPQIGNTFVGSQHFSQIGGTNCGTSTFPQDVNGKYLGYIATISTFAPLGIDLVICSAFGARPVQTYFTSLQINSTTLTSASATAFGNYPTFGGCSEWQWNTASGLVTGTTYFVGYK